MENPNKTGFCPKCNFGAVKTSRSWNYKTGQVFCRWTCLNKECQYSGLLTVPLLDETGKEEGELFMSREEWIEDCKLSDPNYDLDKLIVAKKRG